MTALDRWDDWEARAFPEDSGRPRPDEPVNPWADWRPPTWRQYVLNISIDSLCRLAGFLTARQHRR